MRGTRAILLAGAGALAALTVGVPAQAQSTSGRVTVWADRTGYDDYEWIDRADAVSETIGEAPPDTSFAFANETAWAWTLEDGTVLVVEELPDGPHGYYFEAGSDAPFLVRDPEMSFGFVEGLVAVVYGADGEVLGRAEGRTWLDAAMRGFERGKQLKRAMARRDRWRNIGVSAWIDLSYLLYDWRDQWDQGRRRHPGWLRHHQRRGAEHRRRWQHERQRRQLLGDVFRRWSETGFRGRAPGRFTPPAPGTQPPRRWGGRGRPGDHDGPGNGARRPPREGRPLVEGGPQPDPGVGPGGRGRLSGANPSGGPRPPRSGSPRSERPRPEPQAPATVTVPMVPPAAETPPAPVAEPPRARPRPETRSGEPRVRMPRPAPETGGDDSPPRLRYSAPAPRPVPTERPDFAPPAPQRVQAAPSYAPAPAPTRSYAPAPAPAPARSYTPTPSPTPAPPPARSEPSSSRSTTIRNETERDN